MVPATTTKIHNTSVAEIRLSQWRPEITSAVQSGSVSGHCSLLRPAGCASWKGAQELAEGLEGTGHRLAAEELWVPAPCHPWLDTPGWSGCWLFALRGAKQGLHWYGLHKVPDATRRSKVPFKLPVTPGSGTSISQGGRPYKVGNSWLKSPLKSVGRMTSHREQSEEGRRDSV